MIVLDENIFESQRVQLQSRRMHLCQIGFDVGRKGMQDDEIVALLQRIRRPTFFTRDRDFYKRTLCSHALCLAYIDARPLQITELVRRFLRHAEFNTWSQRRGCVVRIAVGGISVWRIRAQRIARYRWPD